MYQILLVDDHPMVRDGMEAMLQTESDLTIVGSVESGEEALAFCRRKGWPDLVIMDIRMPGLNGFETLERLKRFNPEVAVLLLAGMPLKAEVEDAKRLGARGYLPKSINWEKMIDAVRHAIANDIGFLEEDVAEAKVGNLSPRERDVLKYLSLGKTHEEIGVIHGISSETVRTHVKSILRKLDCPNAAAAVGRAYELGILRP